MSQKLSIVLGKHGQVEDIRSGAVPIEGIELDFRNFERMPDAYRIMARTAEFDIFELAPTTYLMAREAGAPITALPLPMTRQFRHGGLQRLRSSSKSLEALIRFAHRQRLIARAPAVGDAFFDPLN
jgi:4,5-dihydroxyphthalate decarboxylase